MGVLNVTPDSFSDGGEFFETTAAITQAQRMLREGANIIDVGGESTRPQAKEVSHEEELRRVIPVIKGLHHQMGSATVSIDTSKVAVARAALDAGALIINDITAGRGDPAMLELAGERGAAIILMHMQGTPATMQKAPHYDRVVAEVADFFRQRYERAIESGIDPMTIAFDPGIGFGKTVDHNLALLANLEQLRIEERPLVVGVSRKSFLGKLLGSEITSDRMVATAAFSALLRLRGADVLRVHDVKPNLDALRVAEAIRRATS